jgi:hypothetical protein
LVLPSEKPELHLRIGRLMLQQMTLPPDFANVITMADDELLQLAEREHQLAITAATAASSKSSSTAPTSPPSNRPLIEKEGASLMDVCAHLNRGQLMVSDPVERWQYAELNCYLAHRTRESTAFSPALTMALYGMIFLGLPRLLTRDHHKHGDHSGDELQQSGSNTSPTSSISPTEHDQSEQKSGSPTSGVTIPSPDEIGETKGGYAPQRPATRSSHVGDDDDLNNDDDQLLVAPPSTSDYHKSVLSTVWSDDHKRRVALRLYALRLELEYAVGNMAEADAFAPIAQKQAASHPADLARMLVIRSISHIFRTMYPEAIQYGMEALSVLGVPMPSADQYLEHALENQKKIKARIGDRPVAALITALPAVATSEDRLIHSVMADLSVLGYLVSANMMAALATRSVLQSFDRGLAPDLSLMYTWYEYHVANII